MMIAMNNTSSAIWAPLAVLFAGCRFFSGLSNMFFTGCVGILFCPFCHNCAWDVWNCPLIPGDGLCSSQHTVYGSSVCSVVMRQKYTEKQKIHKRTSRVWCVPRWLFAPLILQHLSGLLRSVFSFGCEFAI